MKNIQAIYKGQNVLIVHFCFDYEVGVGKSAAAILYKDEKNQKRFDIVPLKDLIVNDYRIKISDKKEN